MVGELVALKGLSWVSFCYKKAFSLSRSLHTTLSLLVWACVCMAPMCPSVGGVAATPLLGGRTMPPFSRKIAWGPHATALQAAWFGGLLTHDSHMHPASNPYCSGTTHRPSLPYEHLCHIVAATCGAGIQTWPFWGLDFGGLALAYCQ